MIASIVCIGLLILNTAGLIAFFFLSDSQAASGSPVTDSGEADTAQGIWKLNNSYLTDETEFFLPYDGYEYLICDLTITNTTEETVNYSSSAIRLVDLEEEVEIEEDVWAVNSQNSFGSGTLAPGESHTGQVGFQIPLESVEAELNIYENEIDTQPIAVFPISITSTPFIAYSSTVSSQETDGNEDTKDNESSSATEATSFQVNDSSLARDGMTYSLLTVEYSNALKTGQQAPEGKTYVSCYVRVDNTSEITQDNLPEYWILANDNDYRETAMLIEGQEDQYSGGMLEPGESYEGLLVFEAPDFETFTLYAYQSTEYNEDSLEAYWELPLP